MKVLKYTLHGNFKSFKLYMFLFQALSNAKRPQRKSPTKPRKEDSRNREPTNNDPVNNDPRMMAEYQTALELEMWKQQQEELFTAQVCLTNLYIRRAAGSNSCRRLLVAFFCNCSWSSLKLYINIH